MNLPSRTERLCMAWSHRFTSLAVASFSSFGGSHWGIWLDIRLDLMVMLTLDLRAVTRP